MREKSPLIYFVTTFCIKYDIFNPESGKKICFKMNLKPWNDSQRLPNLNKFHSLGPHELLPRKLKECTGVTIAPMSAIFENWRTEGVPEILFSWSSKSRSIDEFHKL